MWNEGGVCRRRGSPLIEHMIDPLQDEDVVFVKATKAPDHSSADRYVGRWLQGATKKESSGQTS